MAALLVWAVALAVFFIIEPLARYFIDTKNLRRFPNHNALSGITNFGYMLMRYGGFRSRKLQEAHQHRPVLRIGPNSVSFSSPDAIRAIYGHSANCVKGDMYAAPAGPHVSLLDVIDKQAHARKRRYMSHALATRNLQIWEFKVADKVERLIGQFDTICDKAGTEITTVDFRKWSNLFTIEAIVDIALSYRLGCLDRGNDYVTITTVSGKEKQVRYIEGLHAGKRATSMLVWSTGWFRFMRVILSSVPGWFRSQRQKGVEFDEMVSYLTRNRLERYRNGEDLDDIIRCVIEDKGGELRRLPQGEIEAEVSVMRK